MSLQKDSLKKEAEKFYCLNHSVFDKHSLIEHKFQNT